MREMSLGARSSASSTSTVMKFSRVRVSESLRNSAALRRDGSHQCVVNATITYPPPECTARHSSSVVTSETAIDRRSEWLRQPSLFFPARQR